MSGFQLISNYVRVVWCLLGCLMYICMVWCEIVLENVLELLSVHGGRFEINQLLFADDTALVADSEEKLCRLVSKFGRVCERINLE